VGSDTVAAAAGRDYVRCGVWVECAGYTVLLPSGRAGGDGWGTFVLAVEQDGI